MTELTAGNLRSIRWRAAGVAAVALLAATVAACSDDDPTAEADTSELVVGVVSLGDQAWAPHLSGSTEEIVTHEVAETLVRQNPETRELEPGLAESWSLSDDGLTWTFKLRANIPFHDDWGTVTAEDVKWSWEQYIREDSLHARAPDYRQAIDNNLDNFEIVSDLEFRLHSSEPVVTLDTLLSNGTPGLLVYPKRYYEEEGDAANSHPIGTGPYKFVSSSPGVEVRLEAVEDHWRQTPEFKSVTFKIIADDAARLAQVRSGDLDIAPVPASLLREAEAANLQTTAIKDVGSFNVIFGGQFPGIGEEYGTDVNETNDDPAKYDRDAPWIQADNPARGQAVRDAVSLAMDRQSLLDQILAGQGVLTQAPLFQYPNISQHNDPSWSTPEYDIDAAKAKLAEGGYPDGFDVTVPIFDQTGRPSGREMGEALASALEALGLNVERMPIDFAVLRPSLIDRATAGWIYIYVTPYQQETIVSTYTPFGTTNHGWDEAIIEAYHALPLEPDREGRFGITRDMLGKLRDKTWAASLFTYDAPYILGQQVGGWNPIQGLAQVANLESVTPAG